MHTIAPAVLKSGVTVDALPITPPRRAPITVTSSAAGR